MTTPHLQDGCPRILVGAIGDGLFTESPIPKKPASMYEEYEFGVKAYRMNFKPIKTGPVKNNLRIRTTTARR